MKNEDIIKEINYWLEKISDNKALKLILWFVKGKVD